MNTSQNSFLVEGILILACLIVGILLGREGKPYGKVKLVIHLFLFVWLAIGFVFILYGFFTNKVMEALWIPVAIMVLTILTELVTGIQLIASKKLGKAQPKYHILSAILLILSCIFAFVITK